MEKSIINKKILVIKETIIPLTKLTKGNYEIIDHVNLTGLNPIKGPHFFQTNNIYLTSTEKNRKIIIAGVKPGVKPTDKERRTLLKAGIQAYCYSLIPQALLAASKGKKVKAVGIVS